MHRIAALIAATVLASTAYASSDSSECKQAKREHQIASRNSFGTAEERRERINNATVQVNVACEMNVELLPSPIKILVQPFITNCNATVCYDAGGGVYQRHGPNLMTGPNGNTCTFNGNMWLCQ